LSSSGPRQKPEPPSRAEALPTSAAYFHLSKCDSLPPPDHQNFFATLHFPKHCPSSEVAHSLRSLHHGRHSPTSCTWLISFQDRRDGLHDARDPIADRAPRAGRILGRKNVTRSRSLAQSFPFDGSWRTLACHPEQAFFARRRACPELAEGIWASRHASTEPCPERATATEGRVWLASFAPLL